MEMLSPSKYAAGIRRGTFGSMVMLAIVILCVPGSGCSFNQVTIREFEKDIVLSKAHSQDDFIGARLIWIGGDGTTKIRVISTGRELKAKPGGYFVSKEYGTEGLQLISASAETGEAKLMARWAD